MRWFLLVFVAGCGGYEEADFIPAKTDLFCDLYIECADPALVVFDGREKDRCVSVYGPVFKTEQEQCKLVPKFAKQCLAEMQNATCPNDNASPDDLMEALPATCGLARKKCLGGIDNSEPPTEDAPTEDTGS